MVGIPRLRKKGISKRLLKIEKRRRYELKKSTFTKSQNSKKSSNKPHHDSTTLVEVPEIFCIVQNPTGVSNFFKNLDKVAALSHFLIDYRDVKVIKPDALLYLLSWMDRRQKHYETKKKLYANYKYFPKDKECRDIIENSGLTKYVQGVKNQENSDVFKIIQGQKAEGKYIKGVIKFVMEKLSLEKSPKVLYNIISECLGNVAEHAYKPRKLQKTWWLMAKFYDNGQKYVRITILDDGFGIIDTIKKSLSEIASRETNFAIKKIAEKIGFRSGKDLGVDDNQLLLSALTRDSLRSSTKSSFRGKGLPFILDQNESGVIRNLKIVTNRAIFDSEQNHENHNSNFNGTLLVWDVFKNG